MNFRQYVSALVLVAPAVLATDLSALKTNEFTEQFIPVGKQGIPLPPGRWQVLRTSQGKASRSDGRDIPVYQVMLSRKRSGQLLALAGMGATEDSLFTKSWNDEGCHGKNTLFKQKLGATFDFPECLAISPEVSTKGELLRVEYNWFRRIGYMQIVYWINPIAVGFSDSKATRLEESNWQPDKLDARHAEYVRKLSDWGQQMAKRVHEGMSIEDSSDIAMLDDIPDAD